MSKNDITGDNLISKGLSEQGKANFDLIFKPKVRVQYMPPSQVRCGDSKCEDLGKCQGHSSTTT